MTDRNAEYARAIGRVLRRRREAAGLSQIALAESVETGHREHYNALERGRRQAKLARLEAYATVLGCKVSDVIREAEQSLERRATWAQVAP